MLINTLVRANKIGTNCGFNKKAFKETVHSFQLKSFKMEIQVFLISGRVLGQQVPRNNVPLVTQQYQSIRPTLPIRH